MSYQNVEIFCPEESDLASRTSARYLRQKAEQVILAGKTVLIDLENVLSISESYADELFAILVENYGFEWFSTNIKLKYSSQSEHVLITIATAIRRRLKSQESNAIKSSVNEIIHAKKKSSSVSKNNPIQAR